MVSSGAFIQCSKCGDNRIPITAINKPEITLNPIAVCTERRTPDASFAPSIRAVRTPAPMDKPVNRLTIRPIMEPVDPTAASACLPAKRPTTAVSAVLYTICKSPVSVTGIAKSRIFLKKGPRVMLVGCVRFSMKYQSPHADHLL